MTEREQDDLAAAMINRAGQGRTRVALSLLVAAMFHGFTGPTFAIVWVLTYALFQGLEQRMLPSSRLARRLGPRGYRHLAVTLTFINSGLFALFSVREAFAGSTLATACAGAMIGGVMINAALITTRSRLLTAAAMTPQVIAIACLPVATLVDGRGWTEAAQMTGGVGLLAGAAFMAWRRLSQTLRDTEAAQRAAEQANQAKSAFLATVSHEIRTPLNGVLGMAQAMAADELVDRQRQRLGVISQSGRALLAIIDDVLDISKIEASRLELEILPFDLPELARQSCDTFDAIAQAKGVDLRLEIAPGVADQYLGDPVRVRQILCNLISNALKFTETGSVRVDIDQGPDGLSLAVADTGPGVGPDQLPRLFQKFVQLDASTTRRFGGSGLGLSICLELAQLMGGRMQADHVLPHGLRVAAILPLPPVTDVDQSDLAVSDPPAPAARPDRPLRVLAAEDHPVNRQVLALLLAQAGIVPTFVEDGAAAVAAWRNGDWDLILMDIQMPVMDGPGAARAIRAAEHAAGRTPVPIIAVTANVMAHQIQAYRQAGMDHHIAKPIEAAALLSVMASALDHAAAAGREAAA